MNDRELLEMAAKAAGYEKAKWKEYTNAPPAMVVMYENPIGGVDGVIWNPLTDDCDALRLAVKCGLSVDRTDNRCWAAVAGKAVNGVYEEFYGLDPYGATRRAIVRAAAAIGAAL